MQLALPLLSTALACLLALEALASAASSTLPATTPSAPEAPNGSMAPLCQCLFNDTLQQTELKCISISVSVEEEEVQVDLIDLLNWDCRYVKMIDFTNMDINYVSADAFASRPDLQFIYLYSDFIEQIDRKAFRGLQSLMEVDLSDNSLLSVDPRMYADNPLLTTVSLASNPLVELKPMSPILESTSITSLDLSFCKLSTLSVESFSMLPNLRTLDISSNSIQQLPVAALHVMPLLNSLSIRNNRWRCDCALKQVLEYTRTISSLDETQFLNIRCFRPDRIMENLSKKDMQKYCPDVVLDDSTSEGNNDDASASEGNDVEDELIDELNQLVIRASNHEISSDFYNHIIITVLAVVVGFVVFVAVVYVVVRKATAHGTSRSNRGSISRVTLIPGSKSAICNPEFTRISFGDAPNGHIYEQIPEN